MAVKKPTKLHFNVVQLGPVSTRDMLALVGYEVPLKTIERWTIKQRDEAAWWAHQSHLLASDNNVRVPPRPTFLKERWYEEGKKAQEALNKKFFEDHPKKQPKPPKLPTLRFDFTKDELAEVQEALDSHMYWQLSDQKYRSNSFVFGIGSDDPENQDAIRRSRILQDRIGKVLGEIIHAPEAKPRLSGNERVMFSAYTPLNDLQEIRVPASSKPENLYVSFRYNDRELLHWSSDEWQQDPYLLITIMNVINMVLAEEDVADHLEEFKK